MPRLLLDELQYRLLDLLAREGGMTFAQLFFRANAATGAQVPETLRAAQALYDLSLVDVKTRPADAPLSAESPPPPRDVWADPSATHYVDDLAPEQLKRAYAHLDVFNVGAVLARGHPADDPYYFAASHLGLSEHMRPGYAERWAAAGRAPLRAEDLPPRTDLPPAEELPTLPYPE